MGCRVSGGDRPCLLEVGELLLESLCRGSRVVGPRVSGGGLCNLVGVVRIIESAELSVLRSVH